MDSESSDEWSDTDDVDMISDEEYKKMLENPVLLPIHYWTKITRAIIFQNNPDIGTGILYYGDDPFGSGNFIDENGNLSQCRPTAEGGWKRECYQPTYTLLFRKYEKEDYMYVASNHLNPNPTVQGECESVLRSLVTNFTFLN